MLTQAPELQVSEWLNTKNPIALADLRGKVVVIEAFQMLCPGCVSHGLPQAMQIYANFRREDVAVLGLHSVFEHHEAQGSRAALTAFMHEYRIPFPVAIDQQSESDRLPKTMRSYALQGTPSIVLIDRQGRIRKNKLGHENEMRLGAEIMALVGEREDSVQSGGSAQAAKPSDGACTDDHCPTG